MARIVDDNYIFFKVFIINLWRVVKIYIYKHIVNYVAITLIFKKIFYRYNFKHIFFNLLLDFYVHLFTGVPILCGHIATYAVLRRAQDKYRQQKSVDTVRIVPRPYRNVCVSPPIPLTPMFCWNGNVFNIKIAFFLPSLFV